MEGGLEFPRVTWTHLLCQTDWQSCLNHKWVGWTHDQVSMWTILPSCVWLFMCSCLLSCRAHIMLPQMQEKQENVGGWDARQEWVLSLSCLSCILLCHDQHQHASLRPSYCASESQCAWESCGRWPTCLGPWHPCWRRRWRCWLLTST